MDPEWAPVRDDAAARRVWHQVLRPIAVQMTASAPALADQVVDRIAAEQPHLLPRNQFLEGQSAGIEASIRQLAATIAAGADPRGLELPTDTVTLGRLRVQQRVPLAYLIRSYRLAQDTLWDWLFGRITAIASDAAEQAAALQLATGWLFAYIDSALARTELVYEAQREAWLRSAAAARTAAIDDVLGEHERDAHRAAQRLRYDLNREHIAVAAWFEVTPEDGDGLLAGVCADLARTLSAETTLIHPIGSLSLTGWLSRRDPFEAARLEPAGLVRAVDLPAGVRVALGEPGWGLVGFRRSHSEAAHARRVATLSGPRAALLTRYRTVAVAALASVDPERAASFATQVLGGLADDDEATYRVATTLAVYLQENRSPARAAARLTVHPNTVGYRVNQAEAILGRSLDADAVELSVALALLPLLPGLTGRL